MGREAAHVQVMQCWCARGGPWSPSDPAARGGWHQGGEKFSECPPPFFSSYFSLGGVTDQFGRTYLFMTLKTQNNLELKFEENFNNFHFIANSDKFKMELL